RSLLAKKGKFVHVADDKAVFANKVVRAVACVGIVLIALDDASIRAYRAEIFVAQVPGEGVRSQQLQAMTEAFAKARSQTVVPARSFRLGLQQVVGRATQKWRQERDICQSIMRLAADGIGRGSGKGLIDGPLSYEVRASCADVTHFQDDVARQRGLHVEAVALENGRSEILCKSGCTQRNTCGCIGRKRR